MSGYFWAKTADDALLVVLMLGGKGYVPGREGAINVDEIFFLERVDWPTQPTAPSLNSVPPSCGAPAAVAVRECAILPFAVRG